MALRPMLPGKIKTAGYLLQNLWTAQAERPVLKSFCPWAENRERYDLPFTWSHRALIERPQLHKLLRAQGLQRASPAAGTAEKRH